MFVRAAATSAAVMCVYLFFCLSQTLFSFVATTSFQNVKFNSSFLLLVRLLFASYAIGIKQCAWIDFDVAMYNAITVCIFVLSAMHFYSGENQNTIKIKRDEKRKMPAEKERAKMEYTNLWKHKIESVNHRE